MKNSEVIGLLAENAEKIEDILRKDMDKLPADQIAAMASLATLHYVKAILFQNTAGPDFEVPDPVVKDA